MKEKKPTILGPRVYTLQSLGVINVTGASISEKDILAHALANVSNENQSQGYAIKRGSTFVNEYAWKDKESGTFTDGSTSNPNHLYSAFPVLLPFALGGIEMKRHCKVS